MIKRFLVGTAPSYIHSYDDIEPERSEMLESSNGDYVLYSSHKVTVTLYNKTLKNYVAVKATNKQLIAENAQLTDENAQLLKRIAELEAVQK